MSRRSPLEQQFDVLELLANGTHKPSRIMGIANLSYPVLRHLLDRLKTFAWIVEQQVGARREYYLTPVGEEKLKAWRVARG